MVHVVSIAVVVVVVVVVIPPSSPVHAECIPISPITADVFPHFLASLCKKILPIIAGTDVSRHLMNTYHPIIPEYQIWLLFYAVVGMGFASSCWQILYLPLDSQQHCVNMCLHFPFFTSLSKSHNICFPSLWDSGGMHRISIIPVIIWLSSGQMAPFCKVSIDMSVTAVAGMWLFLHLALNDTVRHTAHSRAGQ